MLPNLIIIGAPKAGTSSLHSYLQLHPQVAMSIPKELSYFWRDDWREKQAWYESNFEFPGQDPLVRGESTPFYTDYPFRQNVPERMHELVPDVKLIYIVRDPIERLISHWVQRRADGDRTSFEQYMAVYEKPDNRIVSPSRYWFQLQRFIDLFDRSQLLVIDQHDLKVRRTETLGEVFRFIGVDESFESPRFEREINTRQQKRVHGRVAEQLWDRVLHPVGRLVPERMRVAIRDPARRLLTRPVETPVLTPEMRERLVAMLSPEMEELRRFTGKQFETWSV